QDAACHDSGDERADRVDLRAAGGLERRPRPRGRRAGLPRTDRHGAGGGLRRQYAPRLPLAAPVPAPGCPYDLGELARPLSHWGRWGDEDELGTVNFVTPARRVEAAALVRKGAVFSLSIPLDRHGPIGTEPRELRFNPRHVMLQTGTDAIAGLQE